MSAGHPTPGALPDRNLVNAGQIFDPDTVPAAMHLGIRPAYA